MKTEGLKKTAKKLKNKKRKENIGAKRNFQCPQLTREFGHQNLSLKLQLKHLQRLLKWLSTRCTQNRGSKKWPRKSHKVEKVQAALDVANW